MLNYPQTDFKIFLKREYSQKFILYDNRASTFKKSQLISLREYCTTILRNKQELNKNIIYVWFKNQGNQAPRKSRI